MPTPRRIVLVNVIETASVIQSTWRSIGSITRHTSAGGAAIVIPTRSLTGSRSIDAAVSGATGFTSTPVPISKPPITPSRGTMSIQQWNGRGSSRGAVFTTMLYAMLPEYPVQAGERVLERLGERANLVVGADGRSGPGRTGARSARRTARSTAGGHHDDARRRRARGTARASPLDRVGHEIASGGREAREHARRRAAA